MPQIANLVIAIAALVHIILFAGFDIFLAITCNSSEAWLHSRGGNQSSTNSC